MPALLDQQQDLFNMLSKHKTLFDGSLGIYRHKKIHIEHKLRAEPVHHHAYPVPQVHCQTIIKELNHIIELGILKPCSASELTSPDFIFPKKG